ncbi:unnamed protein product, partial [Iphiclides podalirius]
MLELPLRGNQDASIGDGLGFRAEAAFAEGSDACVCASLAPEAREAPQRDWREVGIGRQRHPAGAAQAHTAASDRSVAERTTRAPRPATDPRDKEKQNRRTDLK